MHTAIKATGFISLDVALIRASRQKAIPMRLSGRALPAGTLDKARGGIPVNVRRARRTRTIDHSM
jgi:hypothetical protein